MQAKETKRVLNSSKREIEKETESLKKSLRSQIADFSVEIAERILKREIKKKDHEELVKNTLKELERES